MPNNLNERTQQYLTAQLQQHRAEAASLSADGRGDEAVFARIRANVCEIFSSVWNAAPVDGKQEFFLTKIAQIPQNWRTAKQQAEANGPYEKAHIESLKLDTAAALEAGVRTIWEANP